MKLFCYTHDMMTVGTAAWHGMVVPTPGHNDTFFAVQFLMCILGVLIKGWCIFSTIQSIRLMYKHLDNRLHIYTCVCVCLWMFERISHLCGTTDPVSPTLYIAQNIFIESNLIRDIFQSCQFHENNVKFTLWSYLQY